MATISIANLKTITDSIARQYKYLADAMGTVATASTAAYGAGQNLTRVLGLNDVAQELALLGPANDQTNLLVKGGLRSFFRPVIQALQAHVGGSFDAFLATSDDRVAPEFRDAAGTDLIGPARVFPPVYDPICTFAVSGAGAGTRTGGTPVDTTQYGKANMEVVATSTIGASGITATLTMKLLDGTTQTKSVTIPASTANGTAIAIGVAGTDMYVDCTAITITGGTAADAFKVRSKLERVIAL